MRRAARHYAAWGLLLFAGLVLLLLVGREGYGRQRAQGLQAPAARGRDRGRAGHRARDGPLPALARRAAARGLRRRGGQPRRAAAVARQPGPVAGGPRTARLPLRPAADRRSAGGARHPRGLAAPRRGAEPRGSGRSSRTARGCPASACGRPARWRPMHRTTRGGRRSAGDVAARLVAEHGLVIARWAEALRPVRRHLLAPLAALLVEDGHRRGRPPHDHRSLRRLRRGPAGRLRRPREGGRPAARAGPAPTTTSGWHSSAARPTRRWPWPRWDAGRPLARCSAYRRSDGPQLPDRPPGPGRRRGRRRSWPCLTPTSTSRSAAQPCWHSASSTRTGCRSPSGNG